jgi:serine/threonine protein kinase
MERYHKFKKVGEGTFGCVYKALDRRTSEYVAVKTLKQRSEYQREAQSLSIKHPNMVD